MSDVKGKDISNPATLEERSRALLRPLSTESVLETVASAEALSSHWEALSIVTEASRQYALPIIILMHLIFLTGGILIVAAETVQPTVAQNLRGFWTISVGCLWTLCVLLYARMFSATKITAFIRIIPPIACVLSMGMSTLTSYFFLSPAWTPTTFVVIVSYLLVTVPSMGLLPCSRVGSIMYGLGMWIPAAIFMRPLGNGNLLLYLTLFVGAVPLLYSTMYFTIRGLHQSLAQSDRVRVLMAQLGESNAELDRLHQQADTELKRRSELFNGAAHDFGQRLRLLQLVTDLTRIRIGANNEDFNSLLAAIDDLNVYVSELLQFARLESGVIQPSYAPTSLQSIWGRLKDQYVAVEEAKQVHVKFRTSDEIIVTDDALLRRILENLISNALKFTRGGVLVAARRRNRGLLIEVWDQGPGIPKEFQESIFDAFYQHQAQADRSTVGYGLGLAVVKRLSDILGYSTEFRSALGRGTVFRILIPEHLAAAPPNTTHPSGALPA